MKKHTSPAPPRKRPALAVAALLAVAWAAQAQAQQSLFPLGPLTDPTKPSNRPPALPAEESEEEARAKAKSLGMPGGPQAPGAKAPAGPTVTLRRIDFKGGSNTVVTDRELDGLKARYLNRPLEAGDLEELRYQTTLLYVNKGYISSGALIKQKDLDEREGVLTVWIVEGKLKEDGVRLSYDTAKENEDTWPNRLWPALRDSYIQGRLAGDGERPLNANELRERYLLLLNEQPLDRPLIKQLNGTLLPGLRQDEAVLNLKVVRARPYGAYLEANNFSPPSVGGYAGRMGLWVRNLSGFGEITDFNFTATGGSETYNTGIDIPLTAEGTRFAFRYTNSSNILIEPPFNELDVKSNIISYDGQLSHPVLRSLQQTLTLGLNFNIRQDTTTIGGTPFNRPGADNGQTQETVVRTWQDYLHQGENFDLALRSTFSVGVNALGATVTDEVGDGRFFDWLGQGMGRYHLPASGFVPEGATATLSGAVQLADDELLPLEKMALGGVYTVRGYRQNYLVRDQGFYVALELSYPLHRLWGGQWNPRRGLSLVPFFDYGAGWDYGKAATYLSSAGLGLDWRYDGFGASLYWAGRLDKYTLAPKTPYDLQDNGVTFQVKWQSY